MELRKISMQDKSQLVDLLEAQKSWKTLMAVVPSFLSPNMYEADITPDNPAKYSSEDVRLIEERALYKRKAPSEIFLREWSTSGRNIRPTVQHLQYFLIKSELFAAADYIAENILKVERPVRPLNGPGAVVRFGSAELNEEETGRMSPNVPDIAFETTS